MVFLTTAYIYYGDGVDLFTSC